MAEVVAEEEEEAVDLGEVLEGQREDRQGVVGFLVDEDSRLLAGDIVDPLVGLLVASMVDLQVASMVHDETVVSIIS